MAVTQPQSWNDLDGVPEIIEGTCDKHCTDRIHSPGCALAQMIGQHMYSIPEAVKACENAIEYEAIDTPHNPFWAEQRKYDPTYATDTETKKYKHLMTLLKQAVYNYCDCGAKHDQGGHYQWCTTQKEEKKTQVTEGDVPF
jgi:hypothetical protein